MKYFTNQHFNAMSKKRLRTIKMINRSISVDKREGAIFANGIRVCFEILKHTDLKKAGRYG